MYNNLLICYFSTSRLNYAPDTINDQHRITLVELNMMYCQLRTIFDTSAIFGCFRAFSAFFEHSRRFPCIFGRFRNGVLQITNDIWYLVFRAFSEFLLWKITLIRQCMVVSVHLQRFSSMVGDFSAFSTEDSLLNRIARWFSVNFMAFNFFFVQYLFGNLTIN